MNDSATHAPVLTLPQTHFDRIGGAPAVERLVDAFYRQMDTRVDARTIRAMHDTDLSATKRILVMYLSEWLGGPNAYSASHGHPRLRSRHARFPIGTAERDAWLACMRQALAEACADASLSRELMQSFSRTADWMRNKND